MKRAIAFGRKRRLAPAQGVGDHARPAAALRIGVAAIAVTLALTGCGARDRIADRSHPVGPPAIASDTSAPSTGPAGSTTGTPTTAAGNSSTAAELSSVDRALSGIGSTLSGVDSQITQADKAADSDN